MKEDISNRIVFGVSFIVTQSSRMFFHCIIKSIKRYEIAINQLFLLQQISVIASRRIRSAMHFHGCDAIRIALMIIFVYIGHAFAAADKENNEKKVKETDYLIDHPGSITFTIGAQIKGKIDKPQVMIFLPKEKSVFRKLEFKHSYKEELQKPLPYIPLLE